MKNLRTPMVILFVGLLLPSAAPPPHQARPAQPRPIQPRYRAVVTPPFHGGSWSSGRLFVDHEPLTSALNLFDTEGFEPVLLQAVVDDLRAEKGEYRFVIVGQRR